MGLEDMQQNQVQAPTREEPFYRRTWFCVLMAIIFPPLGIALIWVFKKPAAQSVRIALTVVSAVILVSAIGNMGNGTQAVQLPSALLFRNVPLRRFPVLERPGSYSCQIPGSLVCR